jgi:ATP-dependent Lhr-like helicase
LGNSSWRIRRVYAGRVLVEDAHGAAPSVPFWLGEAPARTAELSLQVAALRGKVSEMTLGVGTGAALGESTEAQAATTWLQRECGLDAAGAEQVVEHIIAGRAILGAVPTQTTVIAERFFDESGGMQLVIHAPFGGRINKAWGLALRKRFCRSFNLELQAAATDDGINISLSEQHSFPLADVFRFLHPASVGHGLEQAVLASPIFTTRWRWNASRALVLARFQGGRRVPPPIQRMRADDLLASVFPDAAACPENLDGEIRIPNHPLVREVMKDALTEAMDTEGLKQVLARILQGSIDCVSVDTPLPSSFSHEILNANPYAYLDDAPLEERRARAVEMRRALPDTVVSDIGRLDPSAIAEVRAEVWPDVRDREELHDALESLIAMPDLSSRGIEGAASENLADEPSSDLVYLQHSVRESLAAWHKYFDELLVQQRIGRAEVLGRSYWVTAEKVKTFTLMFPQARFTTTIATVEGGAPQKDYALRAIVNGWIEHSGPVRSRTLSRLLGISVVEVDNVLLGLEASGKVLRGRFSGRVTEETEWCDRRLLARIHRLTLGKLRKEIEPVSAAKFMDWLLHWQHVAPGTQLPGEDGTLEVLRQLQGYEAPANAWERHILACRVAHYDPDVLDRLCLTGALGWGRLSLHPAVLRDANGGGHRVVPTSVVPTTFFVRDDADWMFSRRSAICDEGMKGLSHAARDVLDFLKARGASFFPDIVRESRKLKTEVETALWELVAAGVITADGFDNLRALIDPRRRAGQGSARHTRPRHSAGRWSLLFSTESENRDAAVESTCWMLLKRYGIVFREVLTRESMAPRWREVLIALRRLEARGEIRGGRFVNGFLGEQFALPIAVDSLRAARGYPASGQIIAVSAADPLNLSGIIVPGARVPANSGRLVSFRDGVAVDVLQLDASFMDAERVG